MLGFPLLLIPFAIYNMIVFITPVDWGYAPYPVLLKSGVSWSASLSDAFLVFSLLMLMFEFIKCSRYGKSLVEHFLSIVLAGGAAAEFVMVKEVGGSLSVLLLFTTICVVDMFAGFAASLRRARRAAYVEPVAPAPVVVHPAPVVQPPPPRFEPTPHPAEPATVPHVKAEPVIVTPVQKIEP